MDIGWIHGRYTLMGTVTGETDTQYFVKVTSYDKRAAAKFLGQAFVVSKQAATVFQQFEAGDKIRVAIFGDTYEFTAIGRGAYPYPCTSQDRYPDAMIFEDATHGWIAETRLQSIGDGLYKMKGLPQ